MKTTDIDSADDRLMKLQFDELRGAETPPDRLHSILSRARSLDSEVSAPHATPWRDWLRPAALALLGVGVTFGVAVMTRGDGEQVAETTETPAQTVAALQDPQPQAPQLQDPARKERPSIAVLKKQVAELGVLIDTGGGDTAKAREQLRATLEVMQKRLANGLEQEQAVATRVDSIRAEIARLEAKFAAEQAAAAAAGGAARGGASRVARALEQLRAELTRLRPDLHPPTVGINPLLVGSYRVAMDDLDVARKRLRACSDPAKSRKIIDEMSRILERARTELWKRQKANEAGVGQPPAKPGKEKK